MKHAVLHDLGIEKARTVADAAFDSYKKKLSQYNPSSNWVTDRRAETSFSVKGSLRTERVCLISVLYFSSTSRVRLQLVHPTRS